jgi:2-C-methyl-D-erythritol 4-phosphate cytidylyltransferase
LVLALILAAGRGERLGAAEPKALAELAGRPLYSWSLEVLRRVPAIERIVLALPPGVAAPAELADAEDANLAEGSSFAERPTLPETIAIQGGAVRSETVRLALAAAPPAQEELVLVHDAARPLLTVALAETVIAAVRDGDLDGAIAASPVTDTIKRVGSDRVIDETLQRSELWAVQTPQVFRRAALERALDVPAEVLAQATDDAWLVERSGGRVAVVEAPRENLKITTPFDLRLAELLLALRIA